MSRRLYEIFELSIYDLKVLLFEWAYGMPIHFSHFQTKQLLSTQSKHRVLENPLFYQVRLEKNDIFENFDPGCLLFDIFYVNFSDTFNSFNNGKLIQYFGEELIQNGLSITSSVGEVFHYNVFEKSGGMSRNSTISFVRDDREGNYQNFKERLSKRIMVNIDIKNAIISKLDAYNGLMLTSGVRIPNLELNSKNVIVVNDIEKSILTDCVTAINKDGMIALLKLYLDLSIDLSENSSMKKQSLDTYEALMLSHHVELSIDDKESIDIKKFITRNFNYIVETILNKSSLDEYVIDKGFKKIIFFSIFYKHFYETKKMYLEDFLSYLEHWDVFNGSNNSLQENLNNTKKLLTDLLENSSTNNATNDANHIFSLLNKTFMNPITSKSEDNQTRWIRVVEKKYQDINLFDGVGLISPDYAQKINIAYMTDFDVEKRPHTSFQIRMPYIKGMLHEVDFVKFYSEKNVTKIFDITNKEHDIKDIKIILTKSQFKAYKWLLNFYKEQIKPNDFNEKYENHLDFYWKNFNQYNHALYISGVNKLSNYNSNMQTLNYQFLHTPQLSKSMFENLIQQAKEKAYNISSDIETRIKLYMDGDEDYDNEEMIDYEQDNDIRINDNKDLNYYKGIVLQKNHMFLLENGIKNDLKKMADKYIANFAMGRIETEGELRYLVSDLLSFLYFQKTDNEKLKFQFKKREYLHFNRFYMPSKKHGILLKGNHHYAVMRNPHITRNEAVFLKPFKSKKSERVKYFGHLKGVIFINPLSLVPERLGGADYDGDMVKIYANSDIVSAVKMNFESDKGQNNRLVLIPHSLSKDEEVNVNNRIRTIKNTFSTRIGLFCNIAFKNSVHAYNINKDLKLNDDSKERNTEYLSILTGLEIDSVKNGEKPKLPQFDIEKQSDYFLKIKKVIKENNFISTRNKDIILRDDTDPNIYQLPYIAMSIKKDTSKQNRQINKKLSILKSKYPALFEFEEDEMWRVKLDQDKKMQIAGIITAYQSYLRYLSGIQNKKRRTENSELQKAFEIVQYQYGNSREQELSRIQYILAHTHLGEEKNKIEELKLIKSNLLNMNWHQLTVREDKINLLNSMFDNKIEANEKELLMNFSEKGYYLLYLLIDNTINELQIREAVDYSEFSTKIDININKLRNQLSKQTDRVDEAMKTIDSLLKNRVNTILSSLNFEDLDANEEILKFIEKVEDFYWADNTTDTILIDSAKKLLKQYKNIISNLDSSENIDELSDDDFISLMIKQHYSNITEFKEFKDFKYIKDFISKLEQEYIKIMKISGDVSSTNIEFMKHYYDMYHNFSLEHGLLQEKSINLVKNPLIKKTKELIFKVLLDEKESWEDVAVKYLYDIESLGIDKKQTVLWELFAKNVAYQTKDYRKNLLFQNEYKGVEKDA